MRLVVARLEQIVSEVFLGDVVDRKVRSLIEELRADRVEDGLSREEAAQPVRHRVEVEDGARRRVGREVEAARRPVAEGPGAGRESHGGTLPAVAHAMSTWRSRARW